MPAYVFFNSFRNGSMYMSCCLSNQLHRPGDQYHGGNVKNPYEERVVNGFTAQEIATLQSRLNKQLGPEYISQRPGNGGGRVAYLEGNKAIALANEVFGFNGWSSSLGQVQIDYVRLFFSEDGAEANSDRWTSFRTARSALVFPW